jgi:hypothetical protein
MARRRRQPRRCRIAAPRGGSVCSGNHAVSSTQFSHNAARRAGRAGRQNRLCHVTSATWRRARQGLSAPARPLEPSRLRSTRRGNHGSRAFRRCCHLAERSRFGRVGHLLFKEGGQWLALGLQFVHAGIWRGESQPILTHVQMKILPKPSTYPVPQILLSRGDNV